MAKNKIEQARATLALALQTDPENAATHAALGWANYKAGDPDAAIHHFHESRRLNPNDEHVAKGLKLCGRPFARWWCRQRRFIHPSQMILFRFLTIIAFLQVVPDQGRRLDLAFGIEAVAVVILLWRRAWMTALDVFKRFAGHPLPPPLPVDLSNSQLDQQ